MRQDPDAMLAAMAAVPEAVDPAVRAWWLDRAVSQREDGREVVADRRMPPKRGPARPVARGLRDSGAHRVSHRRVPEVDPPRG